MPPYYVQLYFFCFLLVSWYHGPTPLSTYVVNINERIAQGAADSWDQAARAVFVFLRREHCRVFLDWCFHFFLRQDRCFHCCSEEIRVLTRWAEDRLTQARYPAQILIFSRWKWLAQLYVFWGIPRQGQLVILRPTGLRIFPRRDALGLTGKWALKIINGT